MYLGAFQSPTTNYFISNQIGPWTTVENIIARSSLPATFSQSSGTLTTVFDAADIPAIVAGDYWLTTTVGQGSGNGYSFQFSRVTRCALS